MASDLVDRRLDAWDSFRRPGDALFDGWLVGEYGDLVDALSRQGAQVVWLTWPCAEDKEYRSVFAGTGAFAIDRVRQLNEAIVPRLLERRQGVMSAVDLFALVCPAGQLSYDLSGRTDARKDSLHFSREEAGWLAESLGPAILASAGLDAAAGSKPRAAHP